MNEAAERDWRWGERDGTLASGGSVGGRSATPLAPRPIRVPRSADVDGRARRALEENSTEWSEGAKRPNETTSTASAVIHAVEIADAACQRGEQLGGDARHLVDHAEEVALVDDE